MKKISIALVSLFFSPVLWAISTTSIYTQSGQRISLGDNVNEMAKRMLYSPTKIRSNSHDDAASSAITTSIQYIYEIDNKVYEITVTNNIVTEINFFSKPH